MKALEVSDLIFRYDDETLTLAGVSFDIFAGEYVSLVGHNGSGKSTLAKLLIGLLEPLAGNIKVFDLSLNKENIYKIRNKVAIVFQNPDNQFICTTVEDDIAFGLENRLVDPRVMKDEIISIATKVGMEKYLDKAPENLSGGQKQRVAIAGALATNPDILILDEATSMLDPKGRTDIRNLILEMKKNNPNLTIISITHDIEEAYLSDRVIVLNHGKVVLDDKPDEVFKNKELLTSLNLTIPFVLELKEKLEEQGINITGKDLEGVVDSLCLLK